MTTRTMPMPDDPSFGDQLQAWFYPWFGTPEGWGPYLDREQQQREVGDD